MKLGLNPTSLHVSKCQAPVCKVCVCVCMAKYCLVQCDQTICIQAVRVVKWGVTEVTCCVTGPRHGPGALLLGSHREGSAWYPHSVHHTPAHMEPMFRARWWCLEFSKASTVKLGSDFYRGIENDPTDFQFHVMDHEEKLSGILLCFKQLCMIDFKYQIVCTAHKMVLDS